MEDDKLLHEKFYGLLRYLEQQTGRTIQMVHFSEYAELLDAFSAGEIDLAYLGPLPYAVLSGVSKRSPLLPAFVRKMGRATTPVRSSPMGRAISVSPHSVQHISD